MKTMKLIMAITAVFVFNFSALGANPKKEKNANLAELVIEKLNKDVQLTDSQKIILKERFTSFANKMDNASNKSDEKEKFNSKKIASEEYEMALDSILSTNQKEQLRLKITEREKSIK